MLNQETSVAIVGAGLSGLCLAQALLRAGFDVHVYERDPSPHTRRQGYRITIDKHGAAALKYCLPPHLFEATLATSSSPGEVGYFRFTNRNLGEIFKLTFKHDPTKTDPQVIGQVDRATLRSIMFSGLQDRVHFGKTALRVETMPDGAVLHFTDDSSTHASVIVAADGIHSSLREQLLPDCPIIDTGSRGIYGKTPLMKDGKSLVPKSLENSGVIALGKMPGHAFFFTSMRFNAPPQEVFERLLPDQDPPVSDNYVMWAVLLPKGELPVNMWELKDEALHHLAFKVARNFHPILQRFVEHADVDCTIPTKLCAATRPRAWPPSRATLIGDAVHVMPPTGAHGGNTALRDAALLAEELLEVAADDKSIEQAIQTYQREMISYSFKEVERSTSMLRRMQIKNPLVRFSMLRTIPTLQSFRGLSPLGNDV